MSQSSRVARWGAALVVLCAALLGFGAAPASAHDVLVSTTPSDGATVPRVPDAIVLTFAEPAQALGTHVLVQSPSGRSVAVGQPRLVDTEVRQAVAGSLPPGRYTVLWRVTSADGHPVNGQFTFTASSATTIAAPKGASGSAASGSDGTSAASDGGSAGSSPEAGDGADTSHVGHDLLALLAIPLVAVVLIVAWRQRGTRDDADLEE
ncbi:MAG: copper resistance CopC family protein [Actinomycetales bacterium]